MSIPVTLSAAAIGGAALTEGIKFLYGQAGDILRRLRQRQDNTAQQANQPEIINLTLPTSVFKGNLTNATINFEMVEQKKEQLQQLRTGLNTYVEGIDIVNENDTDLLKKVDGLRSLLEEIYGQQITFKGENNRPASGAPIVVGLVEADDVEDSEAVGAEAEKVRRGKVEGTAKVKRIKSKGKVSGTQVGEVG